MQIDKTTCLNGALWRSDNLAGRLVPAAYKDVDGELQKQFAC